jgi:hypothetical protein
MDVVGVFWWPEVGLARLAGILTAWLGHHKEAAHWRLQCTQDPSDPSPHPEKAEPIEPMLAG